MIVSEKVYRVIQKRKANKGPRKSVTDELLDVYRKDAENEEHIKNLKFF